MKKFDVLEMKMITNCKKKKPINEDLHYSLMN